MKLTANRNSVRLFLRWTQCALFAGAILTLGYCGFVLLDTWRFQNRASVDLGRKLLNTATTHWREIPAVGPDGLIGRIDVPRIGLSAVVFEGTGKGTLRRAVGHIAGTGLPGEHGNSGLAGHRDTFFRPLRNIALNDLITLTTARGEYRYRVVSVRVANPTDVSVLNPTATEILTLITCYPFYFVGAAPNRFIVRAERVI